MHPGLLKDLFVTDSTKTYADANYVYPDWASCLTGTNGEDMIITTAGDPLKCGQVKRLPPYNNNFFFLHQNKNRGN